MKIIDLLSKVANGEEVPKKIRIDHWCYEFEWVEHDSNYYDKHQDIDLMSCLSMSEEELNYEVHELKEDKTIDRNIKWYLVDFQEEEKIKIAEINMNFKILREKMEEIIDKINEVR